MKVKYYICFFFLPVFFCSRLHAQFYGLPNEYFFSLLTEKQLAVKGNRIHTNVKPYILFFSNKYRHVSDSFRIYKYIVDDPGVETIFFNHLINVEPKKESFKLHIDPVIHLEDGRDFSTKKNGYHVFPYTNSRGVIVNAYIGNNVYVETMVAETQARFPVYIDSVAHELSVVPGQGRWKGFKREALDYAFSYGFVSIQPVKNLNIQLGHGKQKIGPGYRSLVLSDNAFNYPYVRFTQQWFQGRLQYTNIYAVLMNLVPASVKKNPYAESLFQKKAASFQYLSVNLHSAFNLGFFQGMIWRAGSSRNAHDLSWQYFNPVIYANLPVYGLHNQNNILAGADLKMKLTNKLNTYAQVMIDDVATSSSPKSKMGYQAGMNIFDAFGLKNFFIQAEYNNVDNGSFLSPVTATTQGYSHYNQNLAYTPGYGQEFVFLSDYKYRRIFLNLKYNYQDISASSYVNLVSLRLGFLVNPSYNLNISMAFNYRNQNFYTFKTLNNETSYFSVGLRTTLYNTYYDF